MPESSKVEDGAVVVRMLSSSRRKIRRPFPAAGYWFHRYIGAMRENPNG
jgi:hypothetical protein